MTEIDSTLDPFVEAEIKELHAGMMCQMVAFASIIGILLILLGLE